MDEEGPPPTSQKPPLYFTIVNDATGPDSNHTRTFHPRLHYIFTDDDFNPDRPSPYSAAADGAKSSERTILVDFADDAKTVVRATSLSPDWQVTKAEITALAMRPSGNSVDIGKMLTIDGVGPTTVDAPSGVHKTPRRKDGTSMSSSRRSQSAAQTELQSAFAFADLFSQSNAKIKTLLQDPSANDYLAMADAIQARLAESTHEEEKPDSPYVEDENPFTLQDPVMQQSLSSQHSDTAIPKFNDEDVDQPIFASALDDPDSKAEDEPDAKSEELSRTILAEPVQSEADQQLTSEEQEPAQLHESESHNDPHPDETVSPWQA
ncbi:hypothetical protein V1512DRAFT_16917 [Lipomyces arxii]|uniref:uncharacterized protein n=1 Tax=Lipomyces arxii TaxID=56418 RepID=UPI0034CD6123